MGGRTAAILFSKDRALQSRAAVESCFLHVRDAEECALTVLYTASSPAHEDLYRALASDLPQVRFRRERDFKGDLLAANTATGSSYSRGSELAANHSPERGEILVRSTQ